jgi:hypothetical protein
MCVAILAHEKFPDLARRSLAIKREPTRANPSVPTPSGRASKTTFE